jgi:hypothetical protein
MSVAPSIQSVHVSISSTTPQISLPESSVVNNTAAVHSNGYSCDESVVGVALSDHTDTRHLLGSSAFSPAQIIGGGSVANLNGLVPTTTTTTTPPPPLPPKAKSIFEYFISFSGVITDVYLSSSAHHRGKHHPNDITLWENRDERVKDIDDFVTKNQDGRRRKGEQHFTWRRELLFYILIAFCGVVIPVIWTFVPLSMTPTLPSSSPKSTSETPPPLPTVIKSSAITSNPMSYNLWLFLHQGMWCFISYLILHLLYVIGLNWTIPIYVSLPSWCTGFAMTVGFLAMYLHLEVTAWGPAAKMGATTSTALINYFPLTTAMSTFIGMIWILMWYALTYHYGLKRLQRDLMRQTAPFRGSPISGVALTNDEVEQKTIKDGDGKLHLDDSTDSSDERFTQRRREIMGVVYSCAMMAFVPAFCQVMGQCVCSKAPSFIPLFFIFLTAA